jgi:NAD(P)-dependent dehydrogenase (short-subunit alcohol dehydrogenase family)
VERSSDRPTPVVLVTGAGRGLGRATAEAFLRDGADLVLHYHATADGARELAARAEAAGRRALVLAGDLTRGEVARRLVASAGEAFGRLDVVVNNAGGIHRSPVATLAEADWDRMVDVNLKSAFLVTQAAEPWLRASPAAAVVNVASVGALRPRADMPHYCAAKAGLVMLTRCLALALAPAVRVNAFAPAFLAVPSGTPPDHAERLVQRSPLRRMGSYAEAADAIVRLAATPYTTGQLVVFDGGLSLV